MIKQPSTKPIVFYDGACPLCSKEIAHYKKCSGASELNWLDISQSTSELKHYDLDYDQAMRRFHVLSPEGQFHVGAYGFVYLWSFLKPYRFISLLLTRLKLVKPLNWFYLKFAHWRIKDKCDESCGL
jgi:predicted DCC family thiol-disulfide oxidoreductase YuxK